MRPKVFLVYIQATEATQAAHVGPARAAVYCQCASDHVGLGYLPASTAHTETELTLHSVGWGVAEWSRPLYRKGSVLPTALGPSHTLAPLWYLVPKRIKTNNKVGAKK